MITRQITATATIRMAWWARVGCAAIIWLGAPLSRLFGIESVELFVCRLAAKGLRVDVDYSK